MIFKKIKICISNYNIIFKAHLSFYIYSFIIIFLKQIDIRFCCFISTLIKSLRFFKKYYILVYLFEVLLLLNFNKIDLGYLE